MIYLCKAFTLPCKACEATCKGLSVACQESCKCCGKACDAVANFFGPVTRSPLAAYVVGTWLVMVLSIGAFGVTVSQVDCAAATETSSNSTSATDDSMEVNLFCYINIGLALVHIFAARYIQWRITGALRKDEAAGGTEMTKLTHKEVADKATHVALYDVGFCLYVFFFVGAFAYNCYGLTTFKSCEGTGPGWSAAAVKIVYGICVWNYFFLWYCCQRCCGAKEERKNKKEEAKSKKAEAPQAETMGAQA